MQDIHHYEAGYLLSKSWMYVLGLNVSFFSWYTHTHFLIPLLVFCIAIVICLFIFRKLWMLKTVLQQEKVFLEITPPAFTEKTAYTTQQVFSILHDVGSQQSFFDKFLGRKVIFSFEIVSTRNKGIRYIVKTTPEEAQNIEHTVISYLPHVRVKRIADYLLDTVSLKKAKIVEFKLKKRYAFPLAKQNVLTEHDPVAYITGMMTQLQPGELIAFQIVVSPTRKKETDILAHKILNNEDVLGYLSKPRLPWYTLPGILMFKIVVKLINIISREVIWAIHELAHGGSNQQKYAYQYDAYQQQLKVTRQRPARVLSTFEQDVVTSIHEKIEQSLFETSIRVLVVQDTTADREKRIRWMISSLNPFSVPKYQAFGTVHNFLPYVSDKIRLFVFKKRLLSLLSNKSSSILSVSEIADLYHFPYADTTKTEDMVTSKSRELPAPLSLKKSTTELDVVIGKNTFAGKETQVGLTRSQRHEHTYIIGKTGMGKSTIIEGMALQDIEAGKGLAVIDPHGDMIKHILSLIPAHRRKDVIYLNPFDKDFPVGLNILAPGIPFQDKDEEREWITSGLLSILMKITPKQQWGQRMEHILRNTTLTALSIAAPTEVTPYVSLFTIQKLLTDPTYRKQVLGSLQDPVLKQFWQKEYALFGKMQQGDMISPITNKLGEFMTSVLSRNILLQEKTTITIANIMNEGKILLVNLSKGELGEERSAFFGTVITSLIQLAAYSRSSMPEHKRKDFFVYVDEFQNYATHHFHELFSESRKFRVFFIPAHQNIAQFDDPKIAKIVSGSSGTVIMLKDGPDDEAFMLPFFSPEVTKGDIVNLPPHHFFMKVTNEDSEDAFSGVTLPITEVGDESVRDEIIAYSRKHYGTPKAEVEKQLEKLFGVKTKKAQKNTQKPQKKQPKKQQKSSKKHDV